MKLLNLDDLVSPKREVQLNGKVYEIIEQSVGQMIEAIRLEKAGNNPDEPEELLAAMQAMIKELIPDVPDVEVRKMSVRKMSAIIEFANATDEEVIAGSEKTEDGESAEKKS